MTISYSQYMEDYGELVAQKPADASIEGQSAVVGSDGMVSVSFSSSNLAQITALRDWLSTIVGD